MTFDSQLQLAIRIANVAHKGQFRRDGVTPYIEHPSAVALRVKQFGEDYEAVAWLHDVIEDSSMTVDDLLKYGVEKPIAGAVLILSKDGTTYEEYLRGVKAHQITRRVKIADMLHNLSDSPTDRQILKYAKGLQVLLSP